LILLLIVDSLHYAIDTPADEIAADYARYAIYIFIDGWHLRHWCWYYYAIALILMPLIIDFDIDDWLFSFRLLIATHYFRLLKILHYIIAIALILLPLRWHYYWLLLIIDIIDAIIFIIAIFIDYYWYWYWLYHYWHWYYYIIAIDIDIDIDYWYITSLILADYTLMTAIDFTLYIDIAISSPLLAITLILLFSWLR
jgi:hypothetical protein